WCLKNWKTKLATLFIALVLFFGSFALVGLGYIGTDFFPASDKGEFMIQLELEKDASLEKTNFLTQKAESIIESKPEVESIITTVGQSSDRSEEHTSELQSRENLVCRLLLEKKKN